MLNIQNAVRQMRVARRLGKISNDVQTRIMRKFGVNRFALWETMMALRAQVERDCAPVIKAKRVAERECYDIKYSVEPESRKVKVASVTKRVTKRTLTGYEYTPAWWKEAEKRERAAKKAGLLQDA